MLAVAVANGTIKIYQWQDPNNLTGSNEFREINIIDSGECTCLTWNQAFDEPMALIVGCERPKSAENNRGQDPSGVDEDEHEENEMDDLLPSKGNDESRLLRLVTYNPQSQKELDRAMSMNCNSENLHHTQMINDVQWAPLAGRSFNLAASCSKDRTVIIWRIVLINILDDGKLLDMPEISAL